MNELRVRTFSEPVNCQDTKSFIEFKARSACMFLRAGVNAKTITSKFTLPSVLGVRAYLKLSATDHLSRSRSYGRGEAKSPGTRYESYKV